MTFVQTMSFRSFHEDQVRKLLEETPFETGGNGPRRAWLLKDRDRDDTYILSVEFDSQDQAMQHSQRSETSAWAEKLTKMVEGELGYRNYEIVWGD